MIKQMALNIPVSIFKEGEQFIAYTSVLDISTHADSFEKVKERFSELVNLFFEELAELGTTDEVLESMGWQKVRSNWTPPIPVSHEITQVSVSLPN